LSGNEFSCQQKRISGRRASGMRSHAERGNEERAWERGKRPQALRRLTVCVEWFILSIV